ncbi:MAG: hypothetical protein E3J56_05020 [Candidatus Aminicenantes bacterium]|nr:MAG: hypothetical protein E3J56_05020 [Candidatus Aminicenantes bacterium]
MRIRGDSLAAKPEFFGSTLERIMFLKKIFFRIPFRYQFQLIYELFSRGAWRDGSVGLAWARLRVEVWRMIELKKKEIILTGSEPEIPKPPKGNFDSRLQSSDLQ